MEQKRKQDILDLDFRHYIYTTFAETSFPPTTSEVAKHFKISIAAVEGIFERLAEAHHIALAPGSHTIWMAHPFSGLPTNYIAKVENKKYSGNWVWDIFGISVILQKDAKGYAPCGCGECNEKLYIEIHQNQPANSDWLVHFVVPASQFWKNIGYTWATILAFSSKDHLDTWLLRRNIAKGYMMPIQTCWELAQKWYADRLEHDWQRPDQNKTQQLFHSLGLVGDFWNLG